VDADLQADWGAESSSTRINVAKRGAQIAARHGNHGDLIAVNEVRLDPITTLERLNSSGELIIQAKR
jgi:hypothetical protein